jgi:hypothetical protein
MPIHDWTRVDVGLFHAFHHGWITDLTRALNRGLLSSDYYALPEQLADRSGPDGLLAAPAPQPVVETDMAFYRRKQNTVAVHHVSGDRIVAMIEIVSPGNKAARNPLRAFVEKAAELIDKGIHLLILDLFPPGKRDPEGIHNEIWQEIAGEEYTLPTDKPLTLAAYEVGLSVRAYVVQVAVGEELPNMPLFLEPEKAIDVPLEATYQAAFVEVPRRWRRVLEAPAS